MGLTASAARLCRALDAISEWIGRAVAWLTLALALLVCAIVILRYAFHLGWIALQEAVIYLHAAIFLLGIAYTLKHDAHVRVDIFYARLGPKGRTLVDVIGAVVLLLPAAALLLWSSWGYVAVSWSIREHSHEAGGLPGVFLLKALLPLAAGLVLLQGLANLLRNLLRLAGAAEAER